MRASRIPGLAVLVSLSALLSISAQATAASGQPLRTVTYHGYAVTIPRSWPVYNLASAPHTCVRFNRHALYLGVPRAEQRCPARGVGRTEAVLIEPQHATIAAAGDQAAAARPVGGAATTFAVPSAGVLVTATWLHHPDLIRHALHRRSLSEGFAADTQPHPRSTGGGAPTPASTYTGPGFDACDAPSAQQMAAWTSSSPYHAIGVYIGGANAACPPSRDPNLTTTWLANEAAAGWHFIPTYVGLQAPNSGCCAPMSSNSTKAASQGTAAADDAVLQAQSLGLPTGTPLYDDMEYYTRSQTNSSAVLAFLSAWTSELHAKGYLSGVYGNADSAIADLATQYGTSYPEPDDIWFAAWPGDGSQTTSDPNIPSADWANHQRLHQYSGAHNETYGGVTINIDGDYLDGATAGAVSVGPPPPPMLSVSPSGSMTNLTTSWSGLGLTRWEVLAGMTPTALTAIKSAALQGAQTKIGVRSAAPYFAVQAIGSSGQVLASSSSVGAPARLTLFGRSAFYGESTRIGALPIGCYLTTSCQLVATIWAGRTRLTRTRAQTFRAGGNGLLYFKLSWTGRRLLAARHGGELPVQIKITDITGVSTTANMSLIPFSTTGRGPARSTTSNQLLGAAGTTDFIHVGWGWGGILARCGSVPACWVTPTLSVGQVTIGSAGPQLVGGLELGYLFFRLTAQGKRLLKAVPGNQLGATLVLRSGTNTATAQIALVQYS